MATTTLRGPLQSQSARALTAAVNREIAALPNGTPINLDTVITERAAALRIRPEVVVAVRDEARKVLARKGYTLTGVIHHRATPADGPIAYCYRCGERLTERDQAETSSGLVHASCLVAGDEIA